MVVARRYEKNLKREKKKGEKNGIILKEFIQEEIIVIVGIKRIAWSNMKFAIRGVKSLHKA